MNNAPTNHFIALSEITVRKHEDVARPLATNALRDFLKLTDLKEDNIIFVKSYANEYGYPIHYLRIRGTRGAILEWL
ncbi:MAG: hypothetical protein QXM43_00170 [Desulfurococcaceae archaeon]